jgi:hypothetical protein
MYGLFVARMKRGNLPEIDDVDAVVAEFQPARELEGLGGGSPFARGQAKGLKEVRKKIRALMAAGPPS